MVVEMDTCPQCHEVVNASTNRLVQDLCGHKKCRMCLIAEESGCVACISAKKDVFDPSAAPAENIPHFRAQEDNFDGRFNSMLNGVIKFRESKDDTNNDSSFQSCTVHKMIQTEALVPAEISDECDQNSLLESPGALSPVTINEGIIERENGSVINMSDVFSVPKNDNKKTDNINNNNNSNSYIEVLTRKRTPLVIRSHIQIVSESPRQYKCTVCGKVFRKKTRIHYHNYCGSDDKPFKCDECSRSFVIKCHFEYHKRRHSGSLPFICDHCNKRFITKEKLARHMVAHTGERLYMCQECGKCYSSSSSLGKHRTTHGNNVRSHKCVTCNVAFFHKVHLNKHLRSHVGKMCEICGKMLRNEETLVLHKQRIHSHEKPFKCENCNQRFYVKRELSRHSNIHLSEPKFRCSECNMKFGRKDNLLRHVRLVHLESSGKPSLPVPRAKPSKCKLLPAPTCMEDLLSPRPAVSPEREGSSSSREQSSDEKPSDSQSANPATQESSDNINPECVDVLVDKPPSPQPDKSLSMQKVKQHSKSESHQSKFRQVIYSNFQINGNFKQIPVLEPKEKTYRVSVINRTLQNSTENSDNSSAPPSSSALDMTTRSQTYSLLNTSMSFTNLNPVRLSDSINHANESVTPADDGYVSGKTIPCINPELDCMNYVTKNDFGSNYNVFDCVNYCVSSKGSCNLISDSINCSVPSLNTLPLSSYDPYPILGISRNSKQSDASGFPNQTPLSPNMCCDDPTNSPFSREIYDDVVKTLRLTPPANHMVTNTRSYQSFCNFDSSIANDLIDLTVNGSSFSQEPVNLTPAASKSMSVSHNTVKPLGTESSTVYPKGGNFVRTITKAPYTTQQEHSETSETVNISSTSPTKLKFQPKVPTVVNDYKVQPRNSKGQGAGLQEKGHPYKKRHFFLSKGAP